MIDWSGFRCRRTAETRGKAAEVRDVLSVAAVGFFADITYRLRAAIALPAAGILICCGVDAFPEATFPPITAPSDLIRAIDQVQLHRETGLAGYSVTEHYTIVNSHFKVPAHIVVHADYRTGTGKTYEVVSRTGPSLLANTVIDHVLQEEAAMSRGETRRQSLLLSSNYDFRLEGQEKVGDEMCWALDITPRKRSPHLLKGRVWLDMATKTLVRIEGQPPVSASFFAGRPMIVRNYKLIDGFAFAYRSHALSSGFIQGKTEVTIAYDNYVISRVSKEMAGRQGFEPR